MPVLRFYGHFAAAYGTLWLMTLFVALVTQSHLDTGLFGLLGFPFIALIYAIIRMVSMDELGPSSLDPKPARWAVPEGAVACEAFECIKCNHVSRVMTEDGKCIHCGSLKPDPAG